MADDDHESNSRKTKPDQNVYRSMHEDVKNEIKHQIACQTFDHTEYFVT